MNRNILILLTFVGLIGILSGCEKDETKVVLSTNPVAPTLTVPDLTLERANGNDMVVFTGTPVKPGFVASTNYFLEACAQGNNFKDSILILTDKQDAQMKISVSDLNSLLLKSFPADQV
ncbi:MAG TPA: SusE domain-containing protein, partial [Bacteroidales bacterium]|nr:SusE domain-containing protein [Bacteroidales bacterium]